MPFFLILLFVLFLVLLFQTFFGKKKEVVFSAIFVNMPSSPELKEKISDEFIDYAEVDEETSECFFEMDVSWKGSEMLEALDMSQVAGLQKMVVTLSAGECDCVVCDQMTLAYLAKGELVKDVTEVLEAKEFSAYQGRVFYVDQTLLAHYQKSVETGEDQKIEDASEKIVLSKDPSTMQKPVAVGIDIRENYQSLSGFTDWTGEGIVCFPATAKHQEMALRFLEYLSRD